MLFDFDKIQQFYTDLPLRIEGIRKKINKPLTLTEKILFSHLDVNSESDPQLQLDTNIDQIDQGQKKGQQKIFFNPDRVAIRDASAQMALLQFATAGKAKASIPASVHCDQMVIAESGSTDDLARAYLENREVYDFLESVCGKYGIGFWKPGSGIIHQVVLENYAFPGGILTGTDAYISNAGGLGMLACPVGPSELVGALAGMPMESHLPRIIGVRLTGKLPAWTSPKDVALKLWELLAGKELAGVILEYFGEGNSTISCSGKATICNMAVETGISASIFPYDAKMAAYLKATGRSEVADLADGLIDNLKADSAVLETPTEYYEEVIEIDLSTLEPRISGPQVQGIDKSWTLSEFAGIVRQEGFPEKLSASLIGSCVNSSYEDMGKVACLARQAWKHGLKTKSALMITPGSEMTRATLEREGHLKALEEIGGIMFASACGPCAGLWKRHDVTFGEKNSILTSFNRSFSGRHDGNPGTQAFVASPEVAMAIALAGRLTFNPLTDVLITAQGLPVRFIAPEAEELPSEGFDSSNFGYIAPAVDNLNISIIIDPDSKRLQLLKPFDPWNEKEFSDMRILIKAAGKTAADHISPGGKWQRLRGHLDGISESMGTSLANACREEIGKGKNLLTGEIESYAKIAKDYKKEGISWVIVAEENFGDGPSCELVAMMPRHLGCKVVIAKSFAKSCEINLKRQGLLALTFAKWEDYQKMREDDFLDITDIREIAPEKPLELNLKHTDGTLERIALTHSYDAAQIQWFKAGSALNSVRS